MAGEQAEAGSWAASPEPTGEEDSPVAAVERAMVRLRRSQTRRTLGRLATRALERPVDLSLVGVVDAVEDGPERPGGEVTVGAVAERLGIDPSRASRLVAAAVRAGYLARVASQADGRRIGLELTATGEEIARGARRFRQATFGRGMADWSERERREFARLLNRFVDELARASRSG
jgi:DNA-binding MarR family transcriptional regulator